MTTKVGESFEGSVDVCNSLWLNFSLTAAAHLCISFRHLLYVNFSLYSTEH